jgi:hypothetical protein
MIFLARRRRYKMTVPTKIDNYKCLVCYWIFPNFDELQVRNIASPSEGYTIGKQQLKLKYSLNIIVYSR